MGLRFCSIASGSKGNCYLIRTDETVLLLDAGVSGKRIGEGLSLAGLTMEDVNGLLISHEHSDHCKSIRVVMKKAVNASVYTSLATWEAIFEEKIADRQVSFAEGESFVIGDIEVLPFGVHHDVPCVGFTFKADGRQVSVVTDTGHVDEAVFGAVADADLLVIESNHEPGCVEMCSYPYKVKRRILGDFGHLSNESCARVVARVLGLCEKPRRILLAHLSEQNNSPLMARVTLDNVLGELGLGIPVDCAVGVLSQNNPSAVFDV